MPGKVNPVVPEATVMVCAQVMGHHAAITVAGQTGNFQLNVTLPLIAANLLDSIGLLGNISRLLADTTIAGMKVRRDNVARSEEHTSELQSLMRISYAVFCLKKKTHLQLGNRT